MDVRIEKSEMQWEMSKMEAEGKAKSGYGESTICVAHGFADF